MNPRRTNLTFCDNLSTMCGRYRLSRRKQIIEEYFETAPWDDDWEPRYNIAPTQPVPVIRQHPKEPIRQLTLMKWGLIPHWAKDPAVATGTISARSESAATKPTFRDPLKFRRCLIPQTGSTSGHEKAHSSSPIALKSERASCSRWLVCGTAGKTPMEIG